jgi:hypothetical protein
MPWTEITRRDYRRDGLHFALAGARGLFLAVDEQASNRLGGRIRYGDGGVCFVHVYLPGLSRKRGGTE